MHFAEPIWLLSALAVLLPIAIHLWNVRPGRRLKIGSIAFLQKDAKQRSTSLKLTERLLLLLRCLIILLLALFMAKPYRPMATGSKGWALIQPSTAVTAYKQYKPLIDSLLSEGYELRGFAPGLNKKTINELLDTTAGNITDSVSYWNILKQADLQLPFRTPVFLFTDDRLAHFRGTRPVVGMALQWKTVAAPVKDTGFLVNAWTAPGDSVVVISGESNAERTVFHQHIIALDRPLQGDFSLGAANGAITVSYRHQQAQIVDTSTIRVTIFEDKGSDTRYLMAAIQSIKAVNKRKIDLQVANSIQQLPYEQDWLFWLSQSPVPERVIARHLFRYQPGKEIEIRSSINEEGIQRNDNAELYKRVTWDSSLFPVLWRDENGTPLLTRSQNNYHFYSRFDPSWNELPWLGGFPVFLNGLLSAPLMPFPDYRSIDSAQLRFTPVEGAKETVTARNEEQDMPMKIAWICIVVSFFTERWIANSSGKKAARA